MAALIRTRRFVNKYNDVSKKHKLESIVFLSYPHGVSSLPDLQSSWYEVRLTLFACLLLELVLVVE
jgi:hypothetical protein